LKKILYNVIILLIICLNQNALAEPEENDFGIVNAWYNGQEATVKNIYLDVNEQAELKVEIIPKKDCDIYVKISNPMVTEAYIIKSGPSEYDSYFSNKNVKTHENLTFFLDYRTYRRLDKWKCSNKCKGFICRKRYTNAY